MAPNRRRRSSNPPGVPSRRRTIAPTTRPRQPRPRRRAREARTAARPARTAVRSAPTRAARVAARRRRISRSRGAWRPARVTSGPRPGAQIETSRVRLNADARSHRRQFSRRGGRLWGPHEIRCPRLRGRRQVGRTRDRALAASLSRGRAMVRASRATRPGFLLAPRRPRANTREIAPPHPMPSRSPLRPPLSRSVSVSAGSTSGAGTTSAPRSSTCQPTPASS